MSRSLCLMLVWISLCVGGGMTASDAQAQSRDRGRSSAQEAPKARISVDQAANMVRKRTKGTVIGANTRRTSKSIVHRIKVMKDGKVRTYTVDAVSGAIRG